MKKMKVVQIGALHDHSSSVFRTLVRNSDIFDVVGYAVPADEKLTRPEAYEGFRQMSVEEALSIPELDGAVIETGEINLTKYARAAAERNLHIHMDKPGGIVLSDFEDLIHTAKRKQLTLSLGYMYRYNPAVIKMKEDIKSGRLGDIISAEAHMSCMHTPEKRQWLSQFPGGEMFFLGCHLIDIIYSIQGEPEEVIPLNKKTFADGVDAYDFGMAVLKYKNGISFAKSSAAEPCGYMRRQITVCGTKGSIQLMPTENLAGGDNIFATVREVYENEAFDWKGDGKRYNTDIFNRYDGMMRAFYDYSMKRRENPYTYDYELGLYRLILRCCGEEEEK